MANLRFFVDFDGTITRRDVVDMILERFASGGWRDVEREWVEGRIGSRECLSRQMGLVKVSQGEMKKFLKSVEIDPHFADFLKTAHSFSIPVTIVSDGFRFIIQSILENSFRIFPELIQAVPIFSNQIVWKNSSPEASFPEGRLCEHACANCKVRVMEQNNPNGAFTVFVGDGLSDRFAARAATLTFAKGQLLKFCRQQRIEHLGYSSFKDIEDWVLRNSGEALEWQSRKKSF